LSAKLRNRLKTVRGLPINSTKREACHAWRNDVAADLGAASARSLELPVEYSGTGFEFFTSTPPQPLIIPGVTKKVSLWVRADGQPYAWNLTFKDGWGRTEANGQKLIWEVSLGVGMDWKKVSFEYSRRLGSADIHCQPDDAQLGSGH
jgi:hypothetical protein